jgi:hypothetical protein
MCKTCDAGRGTSHNVATPVPHPRSPKAARGDSSGSPERPKRGLSGIDRPLFGRSSEPNARVEGFWQLSNVSGPRISGVPGVMRNAPKNPPQEETISCILAVNTRAPA